MSAILLALLAACTSSTEPVDEDETIRWSGYILDGPSTGGNGYFTGGTVLVEDLTGEDLDEGSEPDPETDPGYWRLDVPPVTDVYLRFAGEGMIPTIFRGTTPESTAYWYSGALWSYLETDWLPFFEQFDGQAGVQIAPLSETVAWLFGGPYDAESWVDAEISVTDGTGVQATVMRWTTDSDGNLVEADEGDPVAYFLAFNLAPGIVSVDVASPDGRALQVTWPALGGEIVSAWFLMLPDEDS